MVPVNRGTDKTQSSFGSESEIILQQGISFKITKKAVNLYWLSKKFLEKYCNFYYNVV